MYGKTAPVLHYYSTDTGTMSRIATGVKNIQYYCLMIKDKLQNLSMEYILLLQLRIYFEQKGVRHKQAKRKENIYLPTEVKK